MIAALAPSDLLINEFLAADRIVLATPMYNFSVPSTLKAYLDNIVRVGRTFTFDRETFAFGGMATGKKALVIVTSAGEYAEGTAAATMDFCWPYLRAIFAFVGVNDCSLVAAPNQFADPASRAAAAAAAQERLESLAATW